MSTWPNRGASGGPCGGLEDNDAEQSREVSPSRSDSSQQASSKPGAVHYHLVLHTRSANLSLLMRHINGVYSQRLNCRHCLVGHLLQGRAKAFLVDREDDLLEVCHGLVSTPLQHSSHQDTSGAML